MMAPMSSTIASVSRKSFRLLGTRAPSNASTPTANAMSVAMGIAQPSSPLPLPTLMATNRSAGTTIPPTAATAGRAARLRSRSSPVTSSRLISSPTTKKKMVMSASFTQCTNDSVIARSPSPMVSSLPHQPTYPAVSALAHTMAPTAASSRTSPLAASSDTKSLPIGVTALPRTGTRM